MPAKTELTRLLVSISPSDYDKWRSDFLSAAPVAVPSKKRPSKSVKNVDTKKESSVPRDLFAALHADTGDLQAAGWNLPPGAHFMNYTRPENAFAAAVRPRPTRASKLPTVARYALTSTVPPSITRALAVGEQIHDELCRKSNYHPIFTGSDAKDHRHAHIFCESINSANAHITHITIFAPDGFDQAAVEALRKMQWTWGFKDHDLRLILHGVGKLDDFDSPLFKKRNRWRSLTPFVATRHAKTFRDGRPKMDDNGYQTGSAAHDLLRLLSLKPAWQGVKIVEEGAENQKGGHSIEIGNRRLRSLQFQTIRGKGEGRRGHDSGSAFVIEFPEAVSGPIAVGYGAHFGLGLFRPDDDQASGT